MSKVDKEQEEARLATIRRLDAELELLKKMSEMGVVLRRDEGGNLTVLPAPTDFDFKKLVRRLRRLESRLRALKK
jgi:hypothetical protein